MEAGKTVGLGFRIGTAWLLAALVALVMPFGLSAAPAGVPAEVTFTRDIAPIVQRSCENCHRPGGGSRRGELSALFLLRGRLPGIDRDAAGGA